MSDSWAREATEISHAISEGYCGGSGENEMARRNSLRLEVYEHLIQARERGIEESEKAVRNIPSISLGGDTYEIVSQVAKAIRDLKKEGSKL